MDSSTALFDKLKTAEPFFLLAGPNVIESEEHVLRMAMHIKAITSRFGLQLVFKSSFDKANWTSANSFRGPGMAEGLKILEKVKIAYDIPMVTDVHETILVAFPGFSISPLLLMCQQCEPVGRVADIIQIPAFLCRQTDLLVAAGKTGKIINIKKGQFCAPSVMMNSAEKPAGKKLEGGGLAGGGLRELIPCIARTAVAVGVDGIFMEIHDDPLNAPVDGPTQWPLRHLEELLEELWAIATVSKGKQRCKIDLSPFCD